MANRIKGITVEIGGDVTGLNKALSSTNKEIRNTQAQLKDVERLLKLDPTNTQLLEQRQRLLAETVSQTKEKLDTLKSAEKQVQEQFERGEVSREQYDALQREIIATEQQLVSLEEQAKKSNATLSAITATADKISTGAQKVADSTKAISTAAGGALVAAGTSAVVFEQDFAKLSTVLDGATTDYDAYKKSVLDGAKEMAVSPKEFTEATYSAISASVDQAKAVEFTADAAKLAKGGFTDLTKSVDVLTTAINGYGLSADDAAKISDLLITTQNLGKTTVDELASSMGAVIPVASSANFSIDELSASYAQLTKNGIATSESGTYLKSMLSELTKNGSVADKTLRQLSGKGFAELKAEGVSTTDILNMLSSSAAENGKTLKDMFGSVEAGSAAMVLAKGSGEEYDSMLSAMGNSAGATEAAFEKMSSTSGASMSKAINDIKISAIQLGDTLAPVISAVADFIASLTSKLASLNSEQLTAVAAGLAVIASISPIAGAISKISGAISFLVANPMVLLVGSIVALVSLIAIKGDEIQAILQKVDDFLQNIFLIDWRTIFGPGIGDILNAFFASFKAVWDSIMQVLNGIIDIIRGVFTGDWRRAWEGVKSVFAGVFNGLVAIAKAPLNGIIGLLNGAIGAINILIGGLNRIGFDLPSWLGGGSFRINIPNIPDIPYLAKGGMLNDGSAIVGEAGPELLTVGNGNAVVQPLPGNTGKIESLLGDISGQLGSSGNSSPIILQVVLDDKVIGETAWNYSKTRERAYG